MSVARTFRWRTKRAFGGHLLEQTFDTPEQAGQWRQENFPDPDEAPLTLVAFQGGVQVPLRASEMAAAHWAWLFDRDNDDESAAAPVEPRPAA